MTTLGRGKVSSMKPLFDDPSDALERELAKIPTSYKEAIELGFKFDKDNDTNFRGIPTKLLEGLKYLPFDFQPDSAKTAGDWRAKSRDWGNNLIANREAAGLKLGEYNRIVSAWKSAFSQMRQGRDPAPRGYGEQFGEVWEGLKTAGGAVGGALAGTVTGYNPFSGLNPNYPDDADPSMGGSVPPTPPPLRIEGGAIQPQDYGSAIDKAKAEAAKAKEEGQFVSYESLNDADRNLYQTSIGVGGRDAEGNLMKDADHQIIVKGDEFTVGIERYSTTSANLPALRLKASNAGLEVVSDPFTGSHYYVGDAKELLDYFSNVQIETGLSFNPEVANHLQSIIDKRTTPTTQQAVSTADFGTGMKNFETNLDNLGKYIGTISEDPSSENISELMRLISSTIVPPGGLPDEANVDLTEEQMVIRDQLIDARARLSNVIKLASASLERAQARGEAGEERTATQDLQDSINEALLDRVDAENDHEILMLTEARDLTLSSKRHESVTLGPVQDALDTFKLRFNDLNINLRTMTTDPKNYNVGTLGAMMSQMKLPDASMIGVQYDEQNRPFLVDSEGRKQFNLGSAINLALWDISETQKKFTTFQANAEVATRQANELQMYRAKAEDAEARERAAQADHDYTSAAEAIILREAAQASALNAQSGLAKSTLALQLVQLFAESPHAVLTAKEMGFLDQFEGLTGMKIPEVGLGAGNEVLFELLPSMTEWQKMSQEEQTSRIWEIAGKTGRKPDQLLALMRSLAPGGAIGQNVRFE
jgi:hypothetical protein